MAVMFGRPKRVRRSVRKSSGASYQFWIGLMVFLCMTFVGALVWYGSRLESLTIASVNVEGGETIDHEAVRAIVETELQGEYYRFVPRRFVWTYPEASIREKVKAFPRVSSVELDTEDAQVLGVYLKEYQPYALWCGSVEAKETCMFVDQEGVAFAEAPALIGTSLLRYKNGQTPSLWEKPFGPAYLQETSRFASEIGQRFSWSVSSIELIGQDEVSYNLRGGGILKTTLHDGVDDTLNNLNVILVSKQFEHIHPGNFDYIDLRFGDKVFVNEGMVITDEAVVATSTTMQ